MNEDLDFCIWCKEQCRQKYPIKGGDFITFDVEIDADVWTLNFAVAS